MTVPPRFPQPDTVIILGISHCDYEFSAIDSNWTALVVRTGCPACQAVGEFGRHGKYEKYYYTERIGILRLRCLSCERTHALIPRFSLPQTSIGTGEAERYLIGRSQGLSRTEAGRQLAERGLGAGYPKQLERRFGVAIERGKALFPHAADDRLRGLDWARAVCGPTDRPLLALNLFALAHGVNALCFTRASILLFHRAVGPRESSHNMGSIRPSMGWIDSW